MVTMNYANPVKPYFIRNPENVSALSGETIEFSCKVGGEPAPYITWTKKDGKIAIGRIQIKEDKTLRIREVKPSDSGVYICEAVNQGGHISSSASLSVDCIPSDFLIQNVADKVPTHSPENLRLAVLNETSANLTWSALPVDQWKGEPRAYFIRLMSTDHRFCSHFNTSPYQTDLILNNLIYGETYEISVAALTSSGIGSLTEPIPLHMVTSYSYNWQTGSPSSSSSSTLSELLLKDTTSLTSNSLTKDPIFIFSAILALFILSFIILILFARRHINWNKGMGAYITVQLNNKCDDLVDSKYTKGNGPLTGPGAGGISASSIGNPGYWLTDKKLSTFTASSSSSSPPKGASKTQSKYHHQANSGPPVPVGQDYLTAHSDESATCENVNEASKRHLTGSINGVPSGEVESELDEVEDCIESDYAEVDDRSLKTFGKRLYSSPSTEPYATTTLMKSFRGSTENTSLLGCPTSSQPNGKSMHSLASSRPVKGDVAGKKLNLSAVSLNSNHYPPHHHRLSSVNGKGNKPLTMEGKLNSQQQAQYHSQHQHLRTNQSNSFHHSSHLLSSSSSSSTSSSNQNITLINCQNGETQTTGKSLLTNYSNGNHLNYHSHHNQHQSRSSSLSTSDLIINSANANSRSSPSASASASPSSSSNCSSTINTNGINNRDNSNLVPSNVTVHCQYHPIVLASSGSYFEKYL
uniref:Ig-like domain-containing protein n=1 Tax=Tetranychus urticae TaxID=32264 RepID=T1K7L5_TETUR